MFDDCMFDDCKCWLLPGYAISCLFCRVSFSPISVHISARRLAGQGHPGNGAGVVQSRSMH